VRNPNPITILDPVIDLRAAKVDGLAVSWWSAAPRRIASKSLTKLSEPAPPSSQYPQRYPGVLRDLDRYPSRPGHRTTARDSEAGPSSSWPSEGAGVNREGKIF
jgi:hypothetical protein